MKPQDTQDIREIQDGQEQDAQELDGQEFNTQEDQGAQDDVLPIKKKPSIKRTLTVIAVALIILLPTILAIVITAYSELNEDTYTFDGVEAVLYNADGKVLFRERGEDISAEKSSLVKILSAIDLHREEYVEGVSGTDTSLPLIASISRNGAVSELTCYFSFISGKSWCVDSGGTKYSIPDTYSEYFMQSPFAEPLHASSSAPTLNTFDGDVILPSGVKWSYLNTSGEWMDATLCPTVNTTATYKSTGGISLSFSTPPSECIAKLYEDSELIYEGDLEGISSVTLTEDVVTVSITASWDKHGDATSYGEQSFGFSIHVQNKSDFLISSTLLYPNKPVLVTATNVTELANLSFASEDTSFKPVFHMRGKTALALIPYPTDVYEKGLSEFSFTLSYGISEHTFTITAIRAESDVLPKEYGAFGIDTSYFASTIDEIFLGGAYASPDATLFTEGVGVGTEISVNGNSVRSPFTEYLCRDKYGVAVKSLYGGRVCFVGRSELLGNYAVIDLGLDVKLWYCYLGEVYVKAGDVVAMGETIGTSGTLGTRTDGAQGFAFMFTYLEHVLLPEYVFDNKFTI